MKKLLLLVLVCGLGHSVFSQAHTFSISGGMMNDRDMNPPAVQLFGATLVPNLDNRFSVNLSLRYEHICKPAFSPYAHLQLVSRKINYSLYKTHLSRVYLNTIELPVGITSRKKVNDNFSFFSQVGGGVNRVITPEKKTLFGVEHSRFSIRRSSDIAAFCQAGGGIETTLTDKSHLGVSLTYQYQLTPLYEYWSKNQYHETTTQGIKPQHLSVNVTYIYSAGGKQAGN